MVYHSGGFWDEESSKREFCYKITPRKISDDLGRVTDQDFNRLYGELGGLGYLFRDAGHSFSHIVVSLDGPISEEHLEELADDFLIEQDRGLELSAC